MPETIMPSISSVIVMLGNTLINFIFLIVEEQPISRHIS